MGFSFSLPEPPPRQQQPGGVAMAPRPVADPALQAFHHYDKDRNGYIEARELAPLLLGLGFFRGMPPEKVQGAVLGELQKADRDGDFAISFDEFRPYFHHLCMVAAKRGHLPRPLQRPAHDYQQAQRKGGSGGGYSGGTVVAAAALGAAGVAAGAYVGANAGEIGAAGAGAVDFLGDGASAAWDGLQGGLDGAGAAMAGGVGGAMSSVGDFLGDALGSIGDFL